MKNKVISKRKTYTQLEIRNNTMLKKHIDKRQLSFAFIVLYPLTTSHNEVIFN